MKQNKKSKPTLSTYRTAERSFNYKFNIFSVSNTLLNRNNLNSLQNCAFGLRLLRLLFLLQNHKKQKIALTTAIACLIISITLIESRQ